jgi:type I restriction enzyme S subunit
MGHIKRSHLSEAQLALPTNSVIKATSSVCEPIYQQVHENEKESQTLANLRDTLLPKLLSGELRVPEAEKQVEEVV